MRRLLRPTVLAFIAGMAFSACEADVCVRNSDCRRDLVCIDAVCVEPIGEADTDPAVDGSTGSTIEDAVSSTTDVSDGSDGVAPSSDDGEDASSGDATTGGASDDESTGGEPSEDDGGGPVRTSGVSHDDPETTGGPASVTELVDAP